MIVTSISSDPFAIGTSAVFSFSSSAAALLIIITSPTAFLLNLLLSVKGGVVVVPFRKNPHKQPVLFRCPRLLLFAPNEEEEVAMQRTLTMLLLPLIVFVERCNLFSFACCGCLLCAREGIERTQKKLHFFHSFLYHQSGTVRVRSPLERKRSSKLIQHLHSRKSAEIHASTRTHTHTP
jgi:hypothetical protein